MAQLNDLLVLGDTNLQGDVVSQGNVTAPKFIGALQGNADTATALTSNAGSATTPIYFKNGKPTACTHTLAKSVPADAKFTDTVYTLPAATTAAFGGVKVGSNITVSSGTISLTKNNVTSALGYTPPTSNTTYNVVTNATDGLVPKFDSADGTIDNSSNDWVLTNNNGSIGWYKLPANAFKNDNTVYTHPTTSGNKHIPAGGSSGQILRWSADGTAAWGSDNNTIYSAGTGLSLSGTTFSNSGVRSIATGSTNGTISVNTNGTSANVKVKGLGTAAYQNTETFASKTEGVVFIEGTGTTNETDKTSTWTGESTRITSYYDGLTIRYKIGVVGQNTVKLNINGLGAKTVYRFNTTKLTTHFPVGSIITLIYHADLNGGCWITNDYDSNTNTQQRVYKTNINKEYAITTRYNQTDGATYYAEYGRYSNGVTLNPSTNTITATTFKGALSGNATSASKVANSLTVKGNGTNSFTYDGSAAKTLNIKAGNNVSVSSDTSGNITIGVPGASGQKAGVTVVYPAANCTTFSSDTGTVTPAAVQKGAKLFSYERLTDSAVTETAIPRFKKSVITINGTKYSGLENTNITIQSVKNSSNNNSASVLCIPAEGGKKMVYGYCTDQTDGTSFIGGVFPKNATSFPHSAGLAIGGTSGNLLWKSKRVLTENDLISIKYGATTSTATTPTNNLILVEDNSPSLPSGGATNQILVSDASGNAKWHSIAKATNTSKRYLVNTGSAAGLDYVESVYTQDNVLFGAAWNDYAEFRAQKEIIEPGYCVASNDNGQVYKTTEKYQACDGIVSDTYGFAIGETKESNTPLAVAGRVLAYFEGNREDYHAGDTVCAGPNGKVCKMTREEVREWPDRIIGIVSEIPQYETWGENNIKVNNRIWIKIR